MRGDGLVQNQRLITQAVMSLAKLLQTGIGFQLKTVTFAQLPASPQTGMLCCITDSTVNTWGGVVAGGGTNKVLAWYNGTSWKVIGQ